MNGRSTFEKNCKAKHDDKMASRLLQAFVATVLLFQGSLCRNCSDVKLGIDEACIDIGNSVQDTPLNITMVYSNCFKCLETLLGDCLNVSYSNHCTAIVTTQHPITIYARMEPIKPLPSHSDSSPDSEPDPIDPGIILSYGEVTKHFIEHSVWMMFVKEMNVMKFNMNLMKTEHGDNAYLPILYAAVTIVVLCFMLVTTTYIYRYLHTKGVFRFWHFRFIDRLTDRDLGIPKATNGPSYGAVGRHGDNDEQEPLVRTGSSVNNSLLTKDTVDGQPNGHGPPTTDTSKTGTTSSVKRSRLRSLDAFRGFSLIIMIFVNYGGGGYWFFAHSKWNGLTVADLVFPWFVWIMGVSIVFSYRSRRKKDSFPSRLYQVMRRTIILFGLGLFLNYNGSLTNWRIPGVLQRFSISYLVVALTELLTVELYKVEIGWWNRLISRVPFWKHFRDITNNWVQWILILLFEFVWLIVTFTLPVPGCPRGYLGPGGIAEDGNYSNCTGGAAGYLDKLIFTNNHTYAHFTAKGLYHTPDSVHYDPEGGLGSLNSIVICFLGVQAGRTLTSFKGRHISILVRLVLWGTILGLVGTVLCMGQKDVGVIPINKNLWSLSFILVMAGSGCVVLAVFYIFIDLIKWWNGSPFIYPGMNSIIVYVGHEILEDYFPFSFPGQHDSHLKLLAGNLIGTSVWLLISFYWHWIGFYVKI